MARSRSSCRIVASSRSIPWQRPVSPALSVSANLHHPYTADRSTGGPAQELSVPLRRASFLLSAPDPALSSEGKRAPSMYQATTPQDELQYAAERLEGHPAEEILHWSLDRYGDSIVLACSFGGPSGMVLL